MYVLPDLNIARHAHNSSSLGEATYVACGFSGSEYLNSVERLWMGASGEAETQVWSLIAIIKLEPRSYPVFSQISPDELCILGGCEESVIDSFQ